MTGFADAASKGGVSGSGVEGQAGWLGVGGDANLFTTSKLSRCTASRGRLFGQPQCGASHPACSRVEEAHSLRCK